MMIGRLTTSLLAGAALSTLSSAQDLVVKAPPQTTPIVIENVTIHPIAGSVIERGMIRFVDGTITQVATAVDRAGAEIVDGDGLHAWPGLVSANTTVGLQEVGALRPTHDVDEVGDLTPEVRAAAAVNPDSTVIPVTRSNGVLVVGSLPSGGLLPGRLSVLQLAGWTWEDMALDDAAGVVVNWPSDAPARGRGRRRGDGERPSAADRRRILDDAFRAAKAYHAARNADPSGTPRDVRWDALGPVLAREKPVFLRADSFEQIRSGVLWCEDLRVRCVLVGGRDARLCLDFLAARRIPVVVTGTHRLPRRRDSAFDAPFRLPLALHAAGIEFCIATSGGYYNERNLAYEAATAVAHGLPLDVAERAVTLNAARLLGVGDRVGSIEVGKDATLILTDGHPLEIRAHVVHAWVQGRTLDLSNKQTVLAAKYREKYRQLGLIKD